MAANLTLRRIEIAQEASHAVRNHRVIGSGSCSHVDETYSDDDLRRLFEGYLLNDVARSVNGLVKIMLDDHKAYLEHSAEIRATAF